MYANQYEKIITFQFDRFCAMPDLVVGPTGCGKTDIIERVYRKKKAIYDGAVELLKHDPNNAVAQAEVAKGDVGFAYLNFTGCEYGDLMGLPFKDKHDQMVYASPERFRDIEKFPRGFACFDEVNRVELQTRQAYMQILDRREIGNIKLPPGWLIVQTANPADDSYQVSDFDKALVRRSSIMELVGDVDVWQSWGLNEYVSPITNDHMNPRVMSLATRLGGKGLIQQVKNQTKPVPTFAGLTMVGMMLDSGIDQHLEKECREILVAGILGAQAATMLEAAMKDDRLKGLMERITKGEEVKNQDAAVMVDLMFMFYDFGRKEPKKHSKAFLALFNSLPSDAKPVLAKACYPWFQMHKPEYADFKKLWHKWCLDNMHIMKGIQVE